MWLCITSMLTIVWLFMLTIVCVFTPGVPTNMVDVRGFDSSKTLILRGDIPRPIGDLTESLSQAILVGIILVGGSGVSFWKHIYLKGVPATKLPCVMNIHIYIYIYIYMYSDYSPNTQNVLFRMSTVCPASPWSTWGCCSAAWRGRPWPYTYVYLSLSLSIYIYIYMYVYVYLHIFGYVCIHIYIYTYIYIYIYIHIYIYRYTHMHIIIL